MNNTNQTFKAVTSKFPMLGSVALQIVRCADTTGAALDQPVHCKGEAVVLATSAKWVLDEPVDFQWMPGGVTTVNASYAGKPIELTVECDEPAAGLVQASFDAWKAQYPKQKPFGCVEHREEEAAVYPEAFQWRDDPEPGVYCTATPTELGARNVNGRIHRSWSPSFLTDAEYAKASERNGVMVFPKGARGSRQNPARITGVAFSVGSLTNKPAFKNILPVRAKESEPLKEAVKAFDKVAGNALVAMSAADRATLKAFSYPTREAHLAASEANEVAITAIEAEANSAVGASGAGVFKPGKPDEYVSAVAMRRIAATSHKHLSESIPVQATWSDKAREAAAEARKASKLAGDKTFEITEAGNKGDHLAAHDLHEQAADFYDEAGKQTQNEGEKTYHRVNASYHREMAKLHIDASVENAKKNDTKKQQRDKRVSFHTAQAKVSTSEIGKKAHLASVQAFKDNTKASHEKAMELHGQAADHHASLHGAENDTASIHHADYENSHSQYSEEVDAIDPTQEPVVKAAEPATSDAVFARLAGANPKPQEAALTSDRIFSRLKATRQALPAA